MWNHWLWGSYMDFLFRHFKVIRLHAKLHDAAGASGAQSGKGPGYCYRIGWGPNSCLLGNVTGLPVCFYVKLFLPSIFKLVDFWSSKSCIVIHLQLTDISVIKESGVFVDGKLHGYSIRPPQKCKPTKQAVWCTRNFHRLVLNGGCLDYSELPNVLPSDVKGGFFAKRTENARLLAV